MIILFLIGAISGIISGMGIGGGVLLIPALTIFLGFDQKVAQGINLIYFIPTAIIAIFAHKKDNNIEIKGIYKPIICGIIGSIIGATIAMNIQGDMLRKLFGYFLLIIGIVELFKKTEVKNGDNAVSKTKN